MSTSCGCIQSCWYSLTQRCGFGPQRCASEWGTVRTRSTWGKGGGPLLAEFPWGRVRFVRQLARPPHPPPEVQVERGDEYRPHDDRVEQDSERNREPQFGQERRRNRGQDRECAREH